MNYNDVKTPIELLKFMDENIRYGFVEDDGKVYGTWNNEEFQNGCLTKWRLSSPERLRNVKYGHCYDQVEFERDWFESHGYSVRTFYIRFGGPFEGDYSCHAYLVFENCGKYYYFEHSDFYNRGIYEFDSYEDAIFFQRQRHIESNSKKGTICEEALKYLQIYEYHKPVYGCTREDFVNFIMNQNRLYIPKMSKCK